MMQFEEKKVTDLIEKNMHKVGRGIRITKDTNDKIGWLIFEHCKRGEKINISRIVERAIDLYCEAMNAKQI